MQGRRDPCTTTSFTSSSGRFTQFDDAPDAFAMHPGGPPGQAFGRAIDRQKADEL
jgi:hypothetical protein